MKKSDSIINRILAGMLVLLGFSSCDDNGGEMYGTPTGHYEIKGTVTEESGEAVENAKIILRRVSKNEAYTSYGDTVLTDALGNYLLKSTGWPESRIRVVCKPEQETLQADSVEFNVDLKGGTDFWNQGSASNTIDFILKKINPEENK